MKDIIIYKKYLLIFAFLFVHIRVIQVFITKQRKIAYKRKIIFSFIQSIVLRVTAMEKIVQLLKFMGSVIVKEFIINTRY